MNRRHFDAVNNERHRLLGKKYVAGLNPAEVARLSQVENEVSSMLRPAIEVEIEQLEQMLERVERARDRVRSIAHRMGLSE